MVKRSSYLLCYREEMRIPSWARIICIPEVAYALRAVLCSIEILVSGASQFRNTSVLYHGRHTRRPASAVALSKAKQRDIKAQPSAQGRNNPNFLRCFQYRSVALQQCKLST